MAVRGKPGDQFVTLYRGLLGTNSDYMEQRQSKGKRDLGIHWSTDPDVAYNFAVGNDFGGVPMMGEEDPSGVVIAAKVHKRHILDPESGEWDDYADAHGIFDPGHSEQEKTLRKGAIVHVEKMSNVRQTDNGIEETLVNPKSSRGWRA